MTHPGTVIQVACCSAQYCVKCLSKWLAVSDKCCQCQQRTTVYNDSYQSILYTNEEYDDDDVAIVSCSRCGIPIYRLIDDAAVVCPICRNKSPAKKWAPARPSTPIRHARPAPRQPLRPTRAQETKKHHCYNVTSAIMILVCAGMCAAVWY